MGSPVLTFRNDFKLIKSNWIEDFDHFTIANSFVKNQKDSWSANRSEKLILKNIQSAQGNE